MEAKTEVEREKMEIEVACEFSPTAGWPVRAFDAVVESRLEVRRLRHELELAETNRANVDLFLTAARERAEASEEEVRRLRQQVEKFRKVIETFQDFEGASVRSIARAVLADTRDTEEKNGGN